MKKRGSKLRMKAFLCSLAMLSGLASTACAANGSVMSGKTLKIYVIGQSDGIQFWDRVKEGATEAAQEFSYDLHYANAHSVADIEGQVKLIDEAIMNKADAIVLAPNSESQLQDALNRARDAGLKLVLIASDFEDRSARTAYVGTNNLISGKIAGRHALSAFTDPLNDKALIVTTTAQSSSAQSRIGGFRMTVSPYVGEQAGLMMAEAAKAAAMANAGGPPADAQQGEAGGPPADAQQGEAGGPPADAQQGEAGGPPADAQQGEAGGPPADVQQGEAGGPPADVQQGEAGGPPANAQQGSVNAFIEPAIECKGDVNLAKAQTKQALMDHPEIKVVYATNETSTIGVCQAVQELNYDPDDLMVIGFNSNDAEIQYLRNGVLDALIVQNPYNMGYIGVYYAGQIVSGNSVSESEDTGVTYVTADNLDSDEVKLILDPVGFVK